MNLLSKPRKPSKQAGFTLVELIIVIVILGILAAIGIPTMSGFIDDAKKAEAEANYHSVYTAASAVLAYSQFGSYPKGPGFTDAFNKDVQKILGSTGTIGNNYRFGKGSFFVNTNYNSPEGAMPTKILDLFWKSDTSGYKAYSENGVIKIKREK